LESLNSEMLSFLKEIFISLSAPPEKNKNAE
jgi:hypothetical protein